MRTFKRKRKSGESKRWYVTWHDSRNDLKYTWQAYTDKRNSEAMGRKLEAVASSKATGTPLTDELRAFVDALSIDQRQKLVELSLVDRAFVDRANVVDEHLEKWHESMADRTDKHRDTSRDRVATVLDVANIKRLADLTTPKLNAALGKLADPPHSLKPMTRTHYRRAVLAFLKWASGERLLAHINRDEIKPIRNAKTERERDALSIDEQRRLIDAAATGQAFEERARGGAVRNSVDGVTRSLVYRLVMETGLRAKEVSALTAGDFNLRATVPTVRLGHDKEKNRKGTTFNLRTDTAELLRDHLQHKAPATAAFNLPDSQNMATMLRADLDAARRAWIAEAGEDFDERQRREKADTLADKRHSGSVVDFHALRNTFITNLARAGVPVAVASKLARHSDVNLTLKLYAKVGKAETADALNTLPNYSDNEPTAMRATGTTDTSEMDREMDHFGARGDGTHWDAIGDSEEGGAFKKPPVGLEPTTCGLQNRCSAN